MYCYFCMKEASEQNGRCSRCGKSFAKNENRNHMLPGTMLKGKYMVGNVLGQGGFGITYAGRDTTLDIRIAIKEYFPNGHASRDCLATNEVTMLTGPNETYYANGKQRFLSEAKALAKFSRSDNIVHARDYFELNNTAYIIMDFVEGQVLGHYLREHKQIEAQSLVNWFMPILEVLGKVHAEGLIHRDISPDNIIIENGKLILIDFGAARDVGATKSMSVMLKPGYAPGEQYTSDRTQQGPWTDIYAVCATMYECITGITPQESSSRLFEDKLQPPSALGISIPPHIEAALMHGMANRYKDRPQTMPDLIAELRGLVAAPPVQFPAAAAAAAVPVQQAAALVQPSAVTMQPQTTPEQPAPVTMQPQTADPDPRTVLMDDPKTVLMSRPSEAIITGVEIGQLTADMPMESGVLTKPMPTPEPAMYQSPEPSAPQPPAERPNRKKLLPIIGVACLVLLVGGIGVAALSKDKPTGDDVTMEETTTTQSSTTTTTTTTTKAEAEDEKEQLAAAVTTTKRSTKPKVSETSSTAKTSKDDEDDKDETTTRKLKKPQLVEDDPQDAPYDEPDEPSYQPDPEPEQPPVTQKTTKKTEPTTKPTTKSTPEPTTKPTTRKTEPPVTEPYSEFEYSDYNDGIILDGWKEPQKDLVIPMEVNGKAVVAIGQGAFENIPGLRSVTFPESDAYPYIEIGNYAFYGNEDLEWVLISNNVERIGANAFGNCKNLSNIYISYSVQNIGSYCFINDANPNYSVYYEGSQWEWDSISALHAFSDSFDLFCPASQNDFLSIVTG